MGNRAPSILFPVTWYSWSSGATISVSGSIGLERPLFHIRFRFWRQIWYFHVQVAPPFPFPVQLGLKRPLFHIRFRFWRKIRHFHVQWRHHFRFRCSKARGPSAVSGIPVFRFSGFRRRERDQNTDLQTQRVGKGGHIPLQLPTAPKLSPHPYGWVSWVP